MGYSPSQKSDTSASGSKAPELQTERISSLHISLPDNDDASSSDNASQDDSASELPTEMDNRCRQDALFTAWANDAMLEICDEELQRPLRAEAEEQMSLKAIMARHETNKRIIASPRDYQMELFERAKLENTIAVLDTGSGKTLIAVLLLRHTLEEELERRATNFAPRTAFFVVDKVMLCQQQFAVLSANIDFSVAQVHGTMLNGIWNKDAWRRNLEENMVIVCTADVLLSCLVHSFVQLAEINLLIFDEAHHAKKGHAYARIIRDFYLAEKDAQKRPRIFGTTASPIDVNVRDLESARSQSMELETLLNARIATPSDPKALQAFVHRPEELVVHFDPPGNTVDGELSKALQVKCGHLRDFRRLFIEAKIQSEELGSWCGDMFWPLAFSTQQAKRFTAKAEKRFAEGNPRLQDLTDIGSVKALEHDLEIEVLNDVKQCIRDYEIPKPTTELATAKMVQLYHILKRQFERSGDSRVLVFVERRSTAVLLHSYFSNIQPTLEHLRCDFLVGNGFIRDASIADSKDHAKLLMNFRNGHVNCIFATSAAEEGLDIQDCNIVIRFDPVKTMIQYIQSRGRARHRNSKLFHMIEKGNTLMHTQVSQVTQSAEIMSDFSTLLPANRILQGSVEDIDEQTALQYEKLPALILPRGAKLTFDFALVVLAHFASCIPHEPGDDMSLTYIPVRSGTGFVCEVIMPSESPVKSVTGSQYSRKALAKRSAAFEACRQLQKAGYLDENLLPIYARQLPALRNARLAVKNNTSTAYSVISKPKLWMHGRGRNVSEYYMTIIDLAHQWQRPTHPLGLLTRQPLPDFPSFPIYRTDGSPCQVVTHSFKHPISMTDQISTLTGFTLRIMLDVFNKSFERDDQHMSYWLVPLKLSTRYQLSRLANGQDLIDWDLASDVDIRPPQAWHNAMEPEVLVKKFLVDPFHGGRRYFSEKIHPTLRPQDAFPPDGYKNSGKSDSIIGNSVSLWKRTALRQTWDDTQPVLVADINSHRLNVLAPSDEQERLMTTKTYICPEPLQVSTLPIEVAAMATVFPGIISRLESYLIALELRNSLQLDITPALMLEAITKDSDNADEIGEERINFQYGMGSNYERLEFIGDTFLKMSTTIAIFARNTAKDEFHMHMDRMHMVCNANLMEHAKRNGHHAYIRGRAFSRRTWYPELKLLKGKAIGEKSSKLHIGDKTIADICEAIIGAALITNFDTAASDHVRFGSAVQAVSIFVEDSNHKMCRWEEYLELYNENAPSYVMEAPTAAQRHLAQSLFAEHPYQFKSARLARSAFSHSSYPRSWEPGIPSYERLEFLGDALLDMASVLHLSTSFGEKRDPQWLTEHKMAMVSNKFLGVLCVKMEFHKHIRYASSSIETAIRKYVADVNEIKAEHDDERNYWMLAREPPKCLADVVEAYLGAIFVDSGFNFREVQRFFDLHIKWFFEDMKIYDTFANNHPIAKLQHFLSETMGCCEYRLMAQEMPSSDGMATKALAGLMVHSQIVSRGHANSVKNAKSSAATAFLRKEMGTAPYEFRQRFGCNCEERRNGNAAALKSPDE